jgi:hypothetical protein
MQTTYYAPLLSSHEHSVKHPDAEAPVDDKGAVVELLPDVLGLHDHRVVGQGQLLQEAQGGQLRHLGQVADLKRD